MCWSSFDKGKATPGRKKQPLELEESNNQETSSTRKSNRKRKLPPPAAEESDQSEHETTEDVSEVQEDSDNQLQDKNETTEE